MIEKLGGKVVYMAKFELKEKDFTPWLSEIAKIKDLDLLVIFGYYFHAQAIKQARDLGIKVPILGCEGFDSPKFIEIAGKAAEGVIIVTDLNRDDPSELVQRFLKEYKEKTGIEADMVAASAYDAVLVLAKAIEKAGSIDPDAIVKALRELKDFRGVTGHILGFTPQGNAIKTMTLQIVKGGKFHHYADITARELITPSE